MNVLSLFDGMSCGQIALERAGFRVAKYFASEVDKWAIKITQKNYPDTIQLGDVRQWQDWYLPTIDLLLGGSPCQGFSIAGKRLNWDDPRSQLFFHYVDCLRWYKPKWFIFENVARMAKDVQDAISYELDVEPIKINSALVSAQNRDRLYWTNIPNIAQPQDRGSILSDVLTSDYDIKCSRIGKYKKYQNKASSLTAGANSGGNHSDMDLLGIRRIGTADNIRGHDYNKRVYSQYGKSPTLPRGSGGNLEPKIALSEYIFRRLTPIEYERLQTVPDNYTAGVSNTQRYKMLGNGWTVDVIVHILKGIKDE